MSDRTHLTGTLTRELRAETINLSEGAEEQFLA